MDSLTSKVWMHCQGRLGRMEELLFLIGLLRAEATSRHLNPTVIASYCPAIDSSIEFFERRHIYDTTVITPNLMSIEHCPMILSVFMTVDSFSIS